MQDRADQPASVHDTATAPDDLHNLHELVAKARQNLNQNDWDYIVGGAESEATLRRNRMALDSLAFRPRVLRDVGKVDPSTTLLGRPLPFPLVLAPTGFTRIADPEGELAVARAADRAGIPYSLSTMATRSIEEVAAARLVDDGSPG